jgi:hypothetical protein
MTPLPDLLKKVQAANNHEARLRIYLLTFLDGIQQANHTTETSMNAEVNSWARTERQLIGSYVTQIIEGTTGSIESRQIAFITGWCDQAENANNTGTINSAVRSYIAGQREMIPSFNLAIMEGTPRTSTAGGNPAD